MKSTCCIHQSVLIDSEKTNNYVSSPNGLGHQDYFLYFLGSCVDFQGREYAFFRYSPRPALFVNWLFNVKFLKHESGSNEHVKE